VPLDPFARSLASLESVIGPFYLAITVARLVSLWLRRVTGHPRSGEIVNRAHNTQLEEAKGCAASNAPTHKGSARSGGYGALGSQAQ
jgi:hypothetical protein